jgi:hypothetical protein
MLVLGLSTGTATNWPKGRHFPQKKINGSLLEQSKLLRTTMTTTGSGMSSHLSFEDERVFSHTQN